MDNQKILVTGGLGYIGSHVVTSLLRANYEVIVIDNLSNSRPEIIGQINSLTNRKVDFRKGDLKDERLLNDLFAENIYGVIHLAGAKDVAESFIRPLYYYEQNVVSLIYLLKAMHTYDVRNLIFSSSASVYGMPKKLPLTEGHDCEPISPYARTKLFCEKIIEDTYYRLGNLNYANLRYFNPAGAHSSGLLGELSLKKNTNLFPVVCDIALGQDKTFFINGCDYETDDGSPMRDFIHVEDLAEAHVAALVGLKTRNNGSYNVGLGQGWTVKEIAETFKEQAKSVFTVKVSDRREGDIPISFAECAKFQSTFDFRPRFTLEQMVASQISWQNGQLFRKFKPQ